MSNTFTAKVTVSPSGVVKLSHGAGKRVSVRSVFHPPSALSIIPNFKTDESFDCGLYSVSDDCPSCSPIKVGRGLLGRKQSMSRKTAKNLRERMCAVELEYGKDNCLFGTLTLPSDDIRSFEMIARYVSYLVNRLNVWLSDNYKDHDFARCGVWEYQKRGALHYHFLLGSHCMDAININDFRYRLACFWMSALEAVEVESETNFFSQNGETRDKSRLLNYEDLGQRFANVQTVEKSVCAYLSGYLSDSNHDSGKDKNGLRKKLYPVATWAQWNRKSTELFKKYSVECEKVFWCEDFNAWSELKSVLLGCLERADKTEQLHRENPFWTSEVIISKTKGLSLVELVNEWFGMLNESGLLVKWTDTVRWKKTSKKQKADRELEEFLHDEKIAEMDIALNARRLPLVKGSYDAQMFGKKVANVLNDFVLNMLLWERELERHLKLDKTLDCPLFAYQEL